MTPSGSHVPRAQRLPLACSRMYTATLGKACDAQWKSCTPRAAASARLQQQYLMRSGKACGAQWESAVSATADVHATLATFSRAERVAPWALAVFSFLLRHGPGMAAAKGPHLPRHRLGATWAATQTLT